MQRGLFSSFNVSEKKKKKETLLSPLKAALFLSPEDKRAREGARMCFMHMQKSTIIILSFSAKSISVFMLSLFPP